MSATAIIMLTIFGLLLILLLVPMPVIAGLAFIVFGIWLIGFVIRKLQDKGKIGFVSEEEEKRLRTEAEESFNIFNPAHPFYVFKKVALI
jgi:uncharacterized membrane protein